MNKFTLLILLGFLFSCGSQKTTNNCKKGQQSAYESYKKMERARRKASR